MLERKTPYVVPERDKTEFNCPICNAYSCQFWYDIEYRRYNEYDLLDSFKGCQCLACEGWSIWSGDKMIWPRISIHQPPPSDMPEEIQKDYEEARLIAGDSPRGAAALLRLVVQKLCRYLGEKGRKIDDDIAALVVKGLPEQVRKALDVVRVIGNNAVHPGTIDIKDDKETVASLFGLVDIIVEDCISKYKKIDEIYGKLPQSARDHINQRDGKAADTESNDTVT